MDFKAFLEIVPKILEENLPGTESHLKMAPPERVEWMKNIDFATLSYRKSAVMMLFYPKAEMTHLVLIIRNSYPGVHSSQIAFPGGKVEEFDISLEATALRETHEEIGITADRITVVRAFSEVYIPPSNFMVFPFLGYSHEALEFLPDPAEVAGIIELPLTVFLDEKTVVSQNMSTSYMKNIDIPAFQIENHIVWGATAMMLSELKDVLKSVL